MILYLHGFRSSPQSFKSRLLVERMNALGFGAQFLSPQLPASPRDAIALATARIEEAGSDNMALVGSSLGGYYATWLAEKHGCKAVLLNPAVRPPRDLEKYVGVTTSYHSNEHFEFKQEYIAELQELAVERISQPSRYFLVAATGDEVLDWREMLAHYPGARQCVIEGSDHGISDFALYADQVLAFCGIETGSRQ